MILLKLKILILVFFAIFFVMSANFKYLFATPSDTASFNLSKGYVHGKIALFLATDSSDSQTSVSIESSGHKINYAPLLSSISSSSSSSSSSLQQGYDFLNGIKGEGSFGFQLPVSSALPGEKKYSPLVHLNFIKWNENFIPRLLVSSEEIEQAYLIGEIQIIRTNIIINSPVIVK
jgi:hypothetical protein